MNLHYPHYDFTPILGWSISRYEVFDKCKRQYFYQYYAKYVPGVPIYKMKQLKDLTSVALEVGNVVHDVLEALLRRLQKSDSDVDEARFHKYAIDKAGEYFAAKTFIEVLYGWQEELDMDFARNRIRVCLDNFMGSPAYSWIFMNALRSKDNWMIEPPGYGETRLDGLKAYCKMDFLFPLEKEVAVLDWKTGRKDNHKHRKQVLGYAAAASSNFGIPMEQIFPRIVYLYPEYDELELRVGERDLKEFFEGVHTETEQMYAYCSDIEQNVPKPMDVFPMAPSESICRYCNYQELCFPDRKHITPPE
jgi:CRISPR/Cas system-associated exonuclease Cas4 (RecB family)